ncbi:MAG: RsmB/NOP family class I SAM-dependent RNA methyltransferase [Sphingobacteriaceae bacterium]|nr:RsmB/NOP family class I SAM-dependent RNA methyltransferase [Sphingobacteriaceae bacterium]
MIAEVRMKQALQALQAYQPEKDLNVFIKTHLKQFPKMGSRDRREVSSLIYDAIRVKLLFPNADLKQQVWLGQLLCESAVTDFVHHWTEQITGKPLPDLTDLASKLKWLDPLGFVADWSNFFPWSEQISSAVELQSFYAAHLMHPITWIRVKSRALQAFLKELEAKGIKYEQHELLPTALAFPAATKLDQLQHWQSGAIEVQDLASQMTAALFTPKKGESWLDACAGSGGKSLMLLDMVSDVRLFVSDIREEALTRLHERFKRAGIRSYSRTQADYTQPQPLANAGSFPKQFDVVLADVPCSGSGTWSATPEMLISQRQLNLTAFTDRQKAITANLVPSIKEGGRLVYLTCSVYKQENEEVVEYLVATHGLKIVEQQYFQASTEGGDVLFGAVLMK